MGYEIRFGKTTRSLQFVMVSDTDHITPVTGIVPSVAIRKAGGSFAAPAGSIVEVGNGFYEVAGNAADAGVLGPLALTATSSGCDRAYDNFLVADAPYLAVVKYNYDASAERDEYTAWLSYDGQPLTSGVTSPSISVANRDTDALVINNQVLTALAAASGAYKYNSTGAGQLLPLGSAGCVTVFAYVGGVLKTFLCTGIVGRSF